MHTSEINGLQWVGVQPTVTLRIGQGGSNHLKAEFVSHLDPSPPEPSPPPRPPALPCLPDHLNTSLNTSLMVRELYCCLQSGVTRSRTKREVWPTNEKCGFQFLQNVKHFFLNQKCKFGDRYEIGSIIAFDLGIHFPRKCQIMKNGTRNRLCQNNLLK